LIIQFPFLAVNELKNCTNQDVRTMGAPFLSVYFKIHAHNHCLLNRFEVI